MSQAILELLVKSTLETIYMVFVAGGVGALFGLPLGIVLATTGSRDLFRLPFLSRSIGAIVNGVRSTPFIILVVAIIPLTRLITGTSIGTTAAIVPLTLASIPFIARITEAAIREVDRGLIEAATAMGATPLQIIFKVLVPEALPGILLGLTLAIVSLMAMPPWSAPLAAGVWVTSAFAMAISGSCPRSWPRSSSFSFFWFRLFKRLASFWPAG